MNISNQGTATQEEAENASKKLNQLTEEIDEGNQTLDKIPHELEKIVDGLTNQNAKSRVVMQATKIQISVNLSESDISEEINQVMNSLNYFFRWFLEESRKKCQILRLKKLAALSRTLSTIQRGLRGLERRFFHFLNPNKACPRKSLQFYDGYRYVYGWWNKDRSSLGFEIM